MTLVIEAALKESLRPDLKRLNKLLLEEVERTDRYLGDLLGAVLSGSGKRIRPALVFLCSRLGASNPDHVMVVAEVVELIHIATLVHDDVIDKAALRRGRKTVVNEHGVDTAVLLGDHVFTTAFARVAALSEPRLVEWMAASTASVCAGEINQLKNRFKFDVTEEEYFTFIEQKTASLFGVSARAGALLAGQDERIQLAAESFGINLGMAFQITDDLLDLTGDEAFVGKTLRTDILNGKMTLPLIHYRNRTMPTAEIKSFYESLLHPNGQISVLVRRMEEAGSTAYSEKVALDYMDAALSNLDAIPRGETRDHLAALVEMLRQRRA